MAPRSAPAFVRAAGIACAGMAVLGWFADTKVEAASTAVQKAIKAGLPHYDPTVRAAILSQRESDATDAAAIYGAKANDIDPPVAATPERLTELVELPRITVRAKQDDKPEPAIRLPRIVVRPRQNDVPPEGFESPAERDARLVKKHLTIFDRAFLNRFTLPLFGVSQKKRAREAEAVEQAARQLGEVADLVETTAEGGGDSEEAKQLTELYREVFMGRPMGGAPGQK